MNINTYKDFETLKLRDLLQREKKVIDLQPLIKVDFQLKTCRNNTKANYRNHIKSDCCILCYYSYLQRMSYYHSYSAYSQLQESLFFAYICLSSAPTNSFSRRLSKRISKSLTTSVCSLAEMP